MVSKNGRRLTVRFDDDFYGEVETYRKLHKIKTWNKALHVRDRENLQRIKELENNGFDKKDAKLNGGQPLSESTTEKPFDYEKWYSDCGYGTYFKGKKKVHCRCTYPSVKKWLPRDRFVDPQICDNCFPTIQRIQEFINTQREEKKALDHTKPYFTNEYGQRIAY